MTLAQAGEHPGQTGLLSGRAGRMPIRVVAPGQSPIRAAQLSRGEVGTEIRAERHQFAQGQLLANRQLPWPSHRHGQAGRRRRARNACGSRHGAVHRRSEGHAEKLWPDEKERMGLPVNWWW